MAEEEKRNSKEEEILAKLDNIANSLAGIEPADYADKDLQDIYQAIEDIRAEVDKLEKNYQALDKQTSKFIQRLDTLESEISDFEASEGVSEENTKNFVTGVVMSLVTGILTYLFAQMKSW